MALEIEISRNPDADRRRDAIALLALAQEVVVPRTDTVGRAVDLQTLGFDPFDALHLACAEQGRATVFLTTDDAFVDSLRHAPGRQDRHTRKEPGILVPRGIYVTPPEQMSDEDFERHALAVLQRELGLYGLARFLRLYRSGTGDYTRDRHRWLEGLSIQDIMTEVERRDRSAA